MAPRHPRYTISGFSTARYATWYFIDELRLLFDAGDGVASSLGSKCQKVQHAFLSHADRDHIGGIIQLNQLAARHEGGPTFYHPCDSGSFPALRDFLHKFDPKLPQGEWVPVQAGSRVSIGRDLVVEVGENTHLAHAGRGDKGAVKSLDFCVIDLRRKLKAELSGMPGPEIAALRARHGEDHVTETFERKLLGFSGDTPGFDSERWRGTDVLLHEATFIAPDAGERGHSELGAVIDAASKSEIGTLVLSHFSARYDADRIQGAIREHCRRVSLTTTVHAVLPHETVWDILARDPVWDGAQT